MELPKPLTAGQWASRLIAWGIIATIAGGVAYVIIQFQNMPPSGH